MAKLKNPLNSLRASGTIAKVLTFARRRHTDLAEKKPIPDDPRTLSQLSWRHMYQKATALWHALSPAEKQDWNSLASRHQMTGFAYFISQALRPNPGLYLPLQGGTMTGDIIMAKNRILELPLPIDSQEPVTIAYFNANLPPGGYTEGARAYHNVDQAIMINTETTLALNSERWDTDTIHDLVTNNSRLTAKTAGTYLIIGNVRWYFAATGYRQYKIQLNGAIDIGVFQHHAESPSYPVGIVSTIWQLALNDYLELHVRHTAATGLNAQYVPQFSCEFMMQRIG